MKQKFALALLLVLLLCLALGASASADGSLSHFTDQYGLLNETEAQTIENRAAELSGKYNCDIYIVILNDYTEYTNGDVGTCATELYTYYDLGYGPDRDGLILLLSMRERDYALITHGYNGNYWFGSHNMDCIEREFLAEFKTNDWYGGLQVFLDMTEDVLATAAANHLTRENEDVKASSVRGYGYTYRYGVTGKMPAGTKLLIGLGVPPLAALAVCFGFKSQMKTAKLRTTAEEYVVPGSTRIHLREDRFVNRTQTRVPIHTENSSGRGSFGGGGGGGGFSGHTGKF